MFMFMERALRKQHARVVQLAPTDRPLRKNDIKRVEEVENAVFAGRGVAKKYGKVELGFVGKRVRG